MTTIAFDTLKFARRLKKAGISEEQAEALSDAFREVQESQMEQLATKGDLRELEARIMGEIRLNRWMLAVVIAVTVIPALKTLFGL